MLYLPYHIDVTASLQYAQQMYQINAPRQTAKGRIHRLSDVNGVAAVTIDRYIIDRSIIRKSSAVLKQSFSLLKLVNNVKLLFPADLSQTALNSNITSNGENVI